MTTELDEKIFELHRPDSMVGDKNEIHGVKGKEIDPNGDVDEKVTIGCIFRQMRQMKVEVAMFLYAFSYVMRSISATAMVMDKACLVHLNYSEEICYNLTAYPVIKTEVERMGTNYHLIHAIIQTGPSAILGTFVGSWSDKYSRKIPVIFALAGMIIDGLGTTICAYFFKSRAEYYFIPAIFTNMFGGFIAVLTVLYSYASDITSTKTRTMKYALMEISFGLSIPLGSLAGGWIFKFFGYVAVFLTSSCGHLLGLFWVLFVLEETRGLDNKDTWQQKFRNFWSTETLVSSFKATMIKRPNRGREQIWLLIAALSIVFFSTASMSSTTFFFVHHQYDWDNPTYSTVSAVFYILASAMMLIIVPLSRRFKISDPCLGIVGSLSLLLKNVGIGLASRSWLYYIACTVGLISTLATLAGRSRISKVVSADDLGKVFSFLTIAEFMLPIAATAVISQVFIASVTFFPGLIFVLLGALTLFPIGIFIWISRLPIINYQDLQNTVTEGGNCGEESEKPVHCPDKK